MVVTTIATALFVAAGAWTFLCRRGMDEVVFSLGLFLVAGACLVRIDALKRGVQELLPGGTAELIKHLLIATGCICIASYGSAIVLNRYVKVVPVICVALSAATTMFATFFANIPWTNADLSEQLAGRPWMITYWMAYYGAFCWSVIAFGTAALRGNSRAPRPLATWLVLLALASLVALVWALLSIAKNIFLLTDVDTVALDAVRNPSAAAFSVLLMVGFLGYVVNRGVHLRREQRNLAALHARLTVLIPEVKLSDSSPEIAEYHRSIEIADALSMLAPYASAADADLIKNVLGRASMYSVRAYCIEIAAGRRERNEFPSLSATFDWADDGIALIEVGRVMSDPRFSEKRQRVTSIVLR